MRIEDYIIALTQIDGLLWQVIGALKAEILKKIPTPARRIRPAPRTLTA